MESDAAKAEDQVTIDYMLKFGWRNVRGGAFCELDPVPIIRRLHGKGFFLDAPDVPPYKFYAVAQGRKTGIFHEWHGPEGVLAMIDGYKGAVYKRLPTMEAAQEWLATHLAVVAKSVEG